MDIWDAVCLVSCALLVAGVTWIYRPAGLIAAGIIGLAVYWVRERSAAHDEAKR